MFVIRPNRNESERQGISGNCLDRCALVEVVVLYISVLSYWHTTIYVSMLICPVIFIQGQAVSYLI